MAKYSEEFKLQMVEEYEGGTMGYKLLARKHGLHDTSPIGRWVWLTRHLEQRDCGENRRNRCILFNSSWMYDLSCQKKKQNRDKPEKSLPRGE